MERLLEKLLKSLENGNNIEDPLKIRYLEKTIKDWKTIEEYGDMKKISNITRRGKMKKMKAKSENYRNNENIIEKK